MVKYSKQVFQSFDRAVLKLLSRVNLYTIELTDSQLLLQWLMKCDNLSASTQNTLPFERDEASKHPCNG